MVGEMCAHWGERSAQERERGGEYYMKLRNSMARGSLAYFWMFFNDTLMMLK